MLNNAHSSFEATQSRPHKHETFLRVVGSVDTGLDNFSNFLADKFSGASSVMSVLDYVWDAQVIPAGAVEIWNFLTGSETDRKGIDNVDLAGSRSVHDLFHDIDLDKFNGPKAAADLIGQLQDHKPSDLITADFIKESIVSNDGFLRKWGVRLMGMGLSLVAGATFGPIIAGAIGLIFTGGFTILNGLKNKWSNDALKQKVSQLNTLTGNGDNTSVDGEQAMREFVNRVRSGGMSNEEIAGARAYFNDAKSGKVGAYLDDMDSHSINNLRGYRWAMGLTAALGGAAAAELVMNHGGPEGVVNALSDAAAAAPGVVSGAASAAATTAGAAVATVGGNVSVKDIKLDLTAIKKELMGYGSTIEVQGKHVLDLKQKLSYLMDGSNDATIKEAISSLDTARRKLIFANHMLLGRSAEEAQRAADSL